MIKQGLQNVVALLITLLSFAAQAQLVTDSALKVLIKSNRSFANIKPVEKLYLQTDKPVYLTGDTLRLKAYLLNADYLSASALSGILYVELDNEEGKSVKRIMLPVQTGLAWGDIALDTAEIKHGNYTLRAYTNWMRNFGEDYIFKKNITISAYNGTPLLVNSLFKQEGNKVEAGLMLKKLNGRAHSFKDVEVRLMSGKKNVSKDKLITGPDGTLQLNFALSQNTEPLSIRLLTTGSEELTVPVTLNRPENTDIQFLPESGALVAGLQSKVGIKAIGEDGKGLNVGGKVFNSKGQEVAIITTPNKGMGSFAFTPQTGETYTAKFNGISKSYLLPAVKTSGTVLSVTTTHPDSLTLAIQSSPGSNTTFYLIGQARGIICYAEPIVLSKAVTKTISKKLFPTGIARFTLLNTQQQPVNERIVFINHSDSLNIKVEPHKSSYTTRDSISLNILVKDKHGNPIQGSFSLAVTDDSQVKIDSLGSNMLVNLLLTSDLKGEIETPAYYFKGHKANELDNLMLTQGWVGYNWKEVFTPVTNFVYEREEQFVVKGKATNAFGKAIQNSHVVLALNRPNMVKDTLTGKLGDFVFKDLFPIDSAIIILQARNKRGKEFNINLEVDEFKEPAFKKAALHAPWYLNTDTTLNRISRIKDSQAQAVALYVGEGKNLAEVVIKSSRIIKDSKNLNGAGEADEILQEEIFRKAGHQSLAEILQVKYEKKFLKLPYYTLYGHIIALFIDGKPSYLGGRTIPEFMNYLSAEDIKGVEIMNSSKYILAYVPNYLYILTHFPAVAVPIVLEVTTYSGSGPYLKKTPGTYLYRPIPFTLPQQFYSPKYTAANKSIARGIDMRSTIFWEPNIVTDANGRASVSFYSTDNRADYSVIIEGTDMEGNLGSSKAAIRSATE